MISSVRSQTSTSVKPPVWVDRTADGSMAVSIPQADIIGSATVREQLPKQDISWRVSTLLFESFIIVSTSRFSHNRIIKPLRRNEGVWSQKLGLKSLKEFFSLCLIAGLAEKGEHVLLVALNTGLVEGVNTEDVTADTAGELEEVEQLS